MHSTPIMKKSVELAMNTDTEEMTAIVIASSLPPVAIGTVLLISV